MPHIRFYKEMNFQDTAIGKIPKGWKVIMLKDIAKKVTEIVSKEKIREHSEKEYVLYSIPAYHAQGKPESIKAEKIGSAKFIVRKGDVLFGKINPKVPKIWIVEHDQALASTEFIVLRPDKNKTLSEFIFYSLQMRRVFQSSIAMAKGAVPSRLRTDTETFMRIQIPLPPFNEQKAIIRILLMVDSAIQRTDEIIAKTKTLKERFNAGALDKGN